MRKPDFDLCENKGADQLCSNCTADQRLCFRDTQSTIPLLHKSEILSQVCVEPRVGNPENLSGNSFLKVRYKATCAFTEEGQPMQ